MHAPGDIVDLTSTSEIFIPPRGRSYMKFSFDFPEPSVVFGDYRFGFLVFTDENTYGLDRSQACAPRARATRMRITCDGFVWAGGQEKAPGQLVATLKRTGYDDRVGHRRRDGAAHQDRHDDRARRAARPGVDSAAAASPTRATASCSPATRSAPAICTARRRRRHDDAAAHGPGVADRRLLHLVARRSRAAEALLSRAGRDELSRRSDLRARRLAQRPPRADADVAARTRGVGRGGDRRRTWRTSSARIALPAWETRPDVPAWMRNVALVTTLHGMHYTGYMFNDYAKMLEILRWMATQIPAERVLAFISAWDGRYYWDYPELPRDRSHGRRGRIHEARERSAEARLQDDADVRHELGEQEAARCGRRSPTALTHKIDGDDYNLNWVDWNNDRHQDGWLGYMNLGVDSWRNHLEGRIADMIERYKVDAYFLDIVGGHVNSTNGDMHEGTRRLVMNLKRSIRTCSRVGEMPYDALHGFMPVYHAGGGARVAEVQSLLLAPERAGAGTREQRRARVGVRPVQHGDAGALARTRFRRCRWSTTRSRSTATRWRRSSRGRSSGRELHKRLRMRRRYVT